MISKSIVQANRATFFILVGEPSADNHAAVLMKSILKLQPNASFIGIGGKKMIEAGLKVFEDMDKLAVMGFIEVIKHIPFFQDLTKRALNQIKTANPKQIILVDYPGFNLHLAKKIKKYFDIPITYYISPQLWAWKEKRIEIIRKYVNQMLVIFPFEESWYKKRGIPARFVGHPIFDEWVPTSKSYLCKELNVNIDYPIITLYPGSRKQELNHHLNLFIEIARMLKNNNSEAQFILGLAENLDLTNFIIPPWIQINNMHPKKALECADLALVASGSATIEAAVFETPMIIIYKMNILSWWLSKWFVKTTFAGMVNIIAGKEIIPEFLQNKATVKSIIDEAITILNNTKRQKKMKNELINVKQALKGKGTSKSAAEYILSLLHSK